MNFTIFGYPRTGKTTLFNLLTGAGIEITRYDSGKKEPHQRTCPVPDPRLDRLSELYPDKEKKPAHIDYTDLAGLAFGEIKTESYLNHLRKADGLTHVVRGFEDETIPHIRPGIAPRKDILGMEEEMILADLMSAETRIEKLEKELKRNKTAEGEKELALLERLKTELEQNVPLRNIPLAEADSKLLRSFAFLSQKPLLHMVNLGEQDIPRLNRKEEWQTQLPERTAALNFCGKIELEILELADEEKNLFMEEYGLEELSDARFLKASYDLLGVATFFTIGDKEVKAWTIPQELPAFEAAGEIHSDIQKGFIRAEVISWEELVSHGSFQAARDKGAVRLEGKQYLVQDGDVLFFRFA
jgi:GTP-binding protein YchF